MEKARATARAFSLYGRDFSAPSRRATDCLNCNSRECVESLLAQNTSLAQPQRHFFGLREEVQMRKEQLDSFA